MRPRERPGSVVSPQPIHYRSISLLTSFDERMKMVDEHIMPKRKLKGFCFKVSNKRSFQGFFRLQIHRFTVRSVARVDIIEFERLCGRRVQAHHSCEFTWLWMVKWLDGMHKSSKFYMPSIRISYFQVGWVNIPKRTGVFPDRRGAFRRSEPGWISSSDVWRYQRFTDCASSTPNCWVKLKLVRWYPGLAFLAGSRGWSRGANRSWLLYLLLIDIWHFMTF